jgi:hypothetical protein
MYSQYVFWIFVLVVGVLMPFVGGGKSWRSIFGILLGGIALFSFGLVSGLSSESSFARLLQLLTFDEKLAPWAGIFEYRFIAVGYALIFGGLLLALRRSYSTRNVSSNTSFEKDA